MTKLITMATFCFAVLGVGAGVYATSGCGMSVSQGARFEYCGQSHETSTCSPWGGAPSDWCSERSQQLGCPESPGEPGPYITKCTCSYDPFCARD